MRTAATLLVLIAGLSLSAVRAQDSAPAQPAPEASAAQPAAEPAPQLEFDPAVEVGDPSSASASPPVEASATDAALAPTSADDAAAPASNPVPAPADGDAGIATDPATAQPELPAGSDALPSASAEAIDRDDLSAFVDGMIKSMMQSDQVAGATIAVVDRDGPLLLRGYGNASFDPELPVDPQTTLFRIGSVSKTFAYIAAMQLVERSQLDLEAEINDYLPDALDIADPDALGPIRVWHLMTHTAGFEDSSLGHLILRDGDSVPTAEEYLERYRPARVRPPGARAVYSNYSVGLLGHIIAVQSGAPFEDVVEQQILQPLGMQHTTFREKLPEGDSRRVADTLIDDWATGQQREAGSFIGTRFEHVAHASAVGGASSSAADMGRYMRMLLGRGQLDGARVLDEETFARMSQVRFRNADAVSGFAHGFFASRFGDLQSLGHGGATLDMMSAMVVLPEAGLGVFISTNSNTGRKMVSRVPAMIFQRYVAAARPAPLPAPDPDLFAQADRFAGSYANLRRNESTLEHLFNSIDTIDVGIDAKGIMRVKLGGDTLAFVRESELVFRGIEGDERLTFLVDENGRATTLVPGSGHWVADRLTWWNHPKTLIALLAASGLFSVLVPLVAWARWSGRRGYATSAAPSGRVPAATLLLACFGWIGFFVMVALVSAEFSRLGNDVVQQYPTPMLPHAVLAAQIAAALSLLALLTLPRAWTANWGLLRKIRHSIVVLTMVAACAAMWLWNMLLAPIGIGVVG